jgi:MFS family permease
MALQTLNISGREGARPGFLEQRFGTGPTSSRRTFDWVFGVIMPVFCFAVDPVIFTSRVESSLLGGIRPFAYVLSYVSIMAMIAWLFFGERLKWVNAFLAGLFGIGAVISFALGLLLLPFSVIGLILVIGILGFTPFFSGAVYLRNAVWAFRAARPFLEKRVVISSFLLAAVFSVAVPWTINMHIKRELDRILSGNAEEIGAAVSRLRYVRLLVDAEPLAREYYRGSAAERRSDRMRALAAAVEELSGKNIKGEHPPVFD